MQCIHYQLPRTPIKESDAKRGVFEDRYGSGATELDALESLHPGELAMLLEQSILRFRDNTIEKRTTDRRNEIGKELGAIMSKVRAAHGMDALMEEYEQMKDALVEIEEAHDAYREAYNELENRYDEEVRSKFNTWHAVYFEPFQANLISSMRAVTIDMEENMPDINAYEVPEAAEVALKDDCLYDSTQNYVPQLASYKQFAGKFSHLTEDDEDEIA